MQNRIPGSPIQVTNFKLPWGKLCQGDDQDKEIRPPFKDVSISPKTEHQFFCSGRESAAAGTEGSFDIHDGDALVGSYYFDCPYTGSNKQQWTQGQAGYVVQIKPLVPNASGAMGLVTLSVYKVDEA